MKIKPAKDRMVREPLNRMHIPADVATEVPDGDSYWVRRLLAGDVVLIEDAPAPAPDAPAPAPDAKKEG